MKTVYKMHYLKTHLSKLVEGVDGKNQIVFGAKGKPQYIISKYPNKKPRRGVYGLLKDQAKGSVAPDLGGWSDSELKLLTKKDDLFN